MPLPELLEHYALAVARMRDLQKERGPGESARHRRDREQAESEVDTLTTLHLLPPVNVANVAYLEGSR